MVHQEEWGREGIEPLPELLPLHTSLWDILPRGLRYWSSAGEKSGDSKKHREQMGRSSLLTLTPVFPTLRMNSILRITSLVYFLPFVVLKQNAFVLWSVSKYDSCSLWCHVLSLGKWALDYEVSKCSVRKQLSSRRKVFESDDEKHAVVSTERIKASLCVCNELLGSKRFELQTCDTQF